LVGYKNEYFENIDKSEILAIMKRGFQAPVELTRKIHFNPKFPEYHNIYIPKINEKYGMVFMNDDWRLIDKNELIDDIYENKRDFIVQNYDKFSGQLNEYKKKSLNRWLNADDDDISVINTKNDIKRLLYDNRHMAMEKKRIMDREKRKCIEIVSLPKRIKEVKPKKKNKSESESENENEYDSSSDSFSNYSYDSKHVSSGGDSYDSANIKDL
jgi:hypothetical protein